MKPNTAFHPAVAQWFRKQFAAPTEPQARAWPAIQAGRNVLVAAPTGSGKTLAAFLAAIDDLIREDRDSSKLPAPLPSNYRIATAWFVAGNQASAKGNYEYAVELRHPG